jgi:hypothetical protein
MTKLVDALQQKNTLTENGMMTNSSSLNHCVDLFFQIGAMRGQDKGRLINTFSKAYAEDSLVAMRLLFWARDIRGGAGERQIFRDIVSHLVKNHKDSIAKNLTLFAEFGRWDDLLTLVGTRLETQALDIIAEGLKDENALCAKWMPREGKNRDKNKLAKVVRKHLNLNPKAYRQLLVNLSNTVEQAMCSKDWDSIDYNKLPSKAMANYMKAFSKNDPVRFQAYMDSLEKGEAKINAGAVYPYDIIKSMKHGGVTQATNAQWLALPNYMENNNERLLPVCDVSGSMGCPAGNNPNVTCMDVSISLGMYIAERNEGVFKDAFVTFSSNPQLQILKGNLSERYQQLKRADWGMSTDLEATYKMILNQAQKHNVPQEEMPTMLIIFSDMEFNQATSQGWGRDSTWNPTAQEMVEDMYAKAGYEMPKVVYWNIQARNDNFPVKFDEQGTALVSGFSPSLLTSLLSGKDLSPVSMMLEVVNSERYDKVTV